MTHQVNVCEYVSVAMLVPVGRLDALSEERETLGETRGEARQRARGLDVAKGAEARHRFCPRSCTLTKAATACST